MAKNLRQKKKTKKRVGLRARLAKFLTKKVVLFFVLLSILGATACLIYLFWGLPSPNKLTTAKFPTSTQIFDRNGKLLYEIYVDQNRTPIKLSQLPEFVKWATISAEDKEFYKHRGFSLPGIVRGSINTLFRGKLQSGSTITQQLVKNALLTQERTIKRKVREFALTLAVEALYSKDQILEMYLNYVPYGGTAWGIESAAKTYFNKSSSELTLSEAALITGLTASPTRYSPFGAHPELATQRQEWVLDQMVENKYITKEQAEAAKQAKLIFPDPSNNIDAPHFVLYVKDQLVEKYGQRLVEQGGLRVTTSLDLDLQNFAQTTIATEVAKLKTANVTNGAALVTNPKTGEILAMVGSKDYFAKDIPGNFNVTTALRQPGSSIKPINYALGLTNGRITLGTVINDMPTCFTSGNQPLYCPNNYDRTFRGPVQVRFALANSLNVPAVKILALNSLKDFIPFANRMGLTSLVDPKNYGLSLTLGGGEVRMTEMATAFSAFANTGIKQNLISVLKVEDYTGKVFEENKPQEGERVISMDVAYLISHALLDNGARSAVFGPSSQLVIKKHPEVSVKTGTTNDKRDNWAIGYNPDILVVTWVGNNDNKPMSAVASGVTGASPIWNKITTFALKDKKENWPIKPEGVIGSQICVISGKLPGDSGCQIGYEYFIAGTQPTETENLKLNIAIDKSTNQPVNSKTAPENVVMQDHSVSIDPLGTQYCLDCPPPTEPIIIRSEKIILSPSPSPAVPL